MSEKGTHDEPSDGVEGSHEPPALEAELVDDATAMEVTAPAPVLPAGDYSDAGVPSFDYVRDRIESRFATSTGATELAGDSLDTTSLDDQLADRDRAGREKLEQIRRSMRAD